MHVTPGEICVIQRGMRFRWAVAGACGLVGRRGGVCVAPKMRTIQAKLGMVLRSATGTPSTPDFSLCWQPEAASPHVLIGKFEQSPSSPPAAARASAICSVALPEGRARGYVLEIFASHFQLPDLGPIGECVEQSVRSEGPAGRT